MCLRLYRREHGLCIRCGQPTINKVSECESCKVKYKLYRQQRKQNFKVLGLCYKCGKVPSTNFDMCFTCRQKQIGYTNSTKKQVIDYYGSKCKTCGEIRLPCLHLDHINNDGNKHRELLPGKIQEKTGTRFYRALVDVNFNIPYQLQILCANCHALKHAGPQEW